jgi:hypothetical protein
MKNSPDPYNQIIDTPKGQYSYDAESDCYTRVYSEQDLTRWNTWGWLYVIAALFAFCWAIS